MPGLTEGRAECFVDRRRDLQRLLPALREGGAQALIITGPDGVGKSALAAHLARLLAPAGYSVLPIYSSPHNSHKLRPASGGGSQPFERNW